MKIINFYGEPGSGKSTLAASLFVQMKKNNYKVELISQYAKDCVYEDRHETLKDQLYIFAKQNHRLINCSKKNLDYVISDSPILLSVLYTFRADNSHLPINSFANFAYQLNRSYDKVNFFILRDKLINYQNYGRLEDEKQLLDIRQKLIHILDDAKESYINIENTINFDVKNLLKYI